jgi:DNA-binding HxlR family transcriptional regulator
MKVIESDAPDMQGLELLTLDPLGQRDCPIADALSVLGERWTILVVRELFYGAHNFNQIAGFTGGSRDLIADRLRTLEAKGIVERRQYSEHPPRYEYHLTESGVDLFPVLMALGAWGTKWATAAPRNRAFMHDCGNPLDITHVCTSCGHEIKADDIRPVEATTAAVPKIRRRRTM